MDERLPLGIEGTPITAGRPLSKIGIVILVLIIILACVAVYYYSPRLQEENFLETQENIPPTANFIYSPESPVTASPVEFIDKSTDEDGSIISRFWDFGDGNTTNETSPTHQYINPGTYTVNLTVTDNKGATHSKVVSITVLSYYYFEETDTIDKSSPHKDATSTTEKSFDVYENAKWLNITVSYSIEQNPPPPHPLAKLSQLDVYLYYFAENDSAASDTSEGLVKTKTISLDAQQIVAHGYGKWSVLLHHYSDKSTANTASYTLTIDVVYE